MNPTDNLLNKIAANKKSHFWLFVVALFVLSFAYIICFYPPSKLFFGHDIYFHYSRILALMESLKNGIFPIYLDNYAINEYGYATKWFYPDLLLLPVAVLGNLTNITFAYKTLLFLLPVLAGSFTYFTIKRIDNNIFTAALSGLLYAFCAYYVQNIFTRSALGEALAMAFIPIVFGGLYEIIKGDYRKWYIFTIGFSLLIFSHVLSSFLAGVISLIFIVIGYKSFLNEKKRLLYLIVAGLITLLVTGYFIYPMLEQILSNTFYYQVYVYRTASDYALNLKSLIYGLFLDYIRPKYNFTPKFGTLLIVVAFSRFFIKKRSKAIQLADICLIIGFLFLICNTTIVAWDKFPLYKLGRLIQFPFRFFIFTSLFFAIADAIYLSQIIIKKQTKIAVLTCLFFLLLGSAFINGINHKKKLIEISVVFERETAKIPLVQGGKEYIPAKVPSGYIDKQDNGVVVKYTETRISGFNRKNGITSFDITPASTGEVAELPLFYYKGYTARLSNKEIPVKESEHGLVEIPVSEAGHVEVYYGGTILQKVSPFISILGILLLGAYIYNYKRKKHA